MRTSSYPTAPAEGELAFTQYCHYQYCKLNGKTGGGGEKLYIAHYWLQDLTAGGCNEGGVECRKKCWLVHNPRINKRISCKGQRAKCIWSNTHTVLGWYAIYWPRVHPISSCSWLQDTLKRKLVDFAWNRRFFYLPGACSPFFGQTRLKVLINPIFFIRSACFDLSSGQSRVNPGKQEGGGREKIKNRRVFFSRYLAANDDNHPWNKPAFFKSRWARFPDRFFSVLFLLRQLLFS